MIKEVKENELFFAKVKEDAIIPTKNTEDMGYDIYSCFDEEYIVINPQETKMIPTGIASACSEDYGIILKERGSTGSKGIAQRCGVIDSGYRSEWFVPLTNTTTHFIIISKLSEEKTSKKVFGEHTPVGVVIYSYTKAIAQAIIVPVPKMDTQEISYEDLKSITSKRGTGCLGSSGK